MASQQRRVFTPRYGSSSRLEGFSALIRNELGQDATVTLGEHEGVQGYWITTPRPFTPQMLNVLQLNSEHWQAGIPEAREGYNESRHRDEDGSFPAWPMSQESGPANNRESKPENEQTGASNVSRSGDLDNMRPALHLTMSSPSQSIVIAENERYRSLPPVPAIPSPHQRSFVSPDTGSWSYMTEYIQRPEELLFGFLRLISVHVDSFDRYYMSMGGPQQMPAFSSAEDPPQPIDIQPPSYSPPHYINDHVSDNSYEYNFAIDLKHPEHISFNSLFSETDVAAKKRKPMESPPQSVQPLSYLTPPRARSFALFQNDQYATPSDPSISKQYQKSPKPRSYKERVPRQTKSASNGNRDPSEALQKHIDISKSQFQGTLPTKRQASASIGRSQKNDDPVYPWSDNVARPSASAGYAVKDDQNEDQKFSKAILNTSEETGTNVPAIASAPAYNMLQERRELVSSLERFVLDRLMDKIVETLFETQSPMVTHGDGSSKRSGEVSGWRNSFTDNHIPEDIPILPGSVAGLGTLKRSTRTYYRRGSIPKGRRAPSSRLIEPTQDCASTGKRGHKSSGPTQEERSPGDSDEDDGDERPPHKRSKLSTQRRVQGLRCPFYCYDPDRYCQQACSSASGFPNLTRLVYDPLTADI